MRDAARTLPHDIDTSRTPPPAGGVLLLRPRGHVRGLPPHWNPEDAAVDVDGRRTSRSGPSHDALRLWLRDGGRSFGDVRGASPGSGSEYAALAFPRNVEWKSLPIVATPDVLVRDHSWGPLAEDGLVRGKRDGYEGPADVRTFPGSEYDASAAAFLVDLPKLSDHALWSTIAPHADRILRHGVPVAWFDGSVVRDVEAGYLAGVADRMRLRDRFLFSYALNATVMASRVMFEIASEDAMTRRRVNGKMPKLGRFGWHAFSPLGLQLLYAFGRSPQVEPRLRADYLVDGGLERWWQALVRACPFVRADDGGRLTFEWFGSGKHAPLRTYARLSDHDSLEADAWEGDNLWLVLSALAQEGWIGVDEAGRMGATAAGLRFLGKIGPSLDDPDAVLRWRGLGTADARPMDRWLNRSFRRLKRRVAPMRASPYVEREDGERLRETEDVVLVTYGGFLDLRKAEDAARRLVERACTEEAAKPPMDRRFGWPISEEGTTADAKTWAWYGVPSCVAEEGVARYLASGCYAEMGSVDAAVATVLVSLSPELRAFAAPARNYLVQAVRMPGAVVGSMFPEPAVPLAERLGPGVVMIGTIERVPDLAACGVHKRHMTRRMRCAPRGAFPADILTVQGGRVIEGGGGEHWEGVEVGLVRDGVFVPAIPDVVRLERYLRRQLRSDRQAFDGVPSDMLTVGTFVLGPDGPTPYVPPDDALAAVLAAVEEGVLRRPAADS